jgi:hypothetical protein
MGEDLNGDGPIQLGIHSTIDDPHAAFSDYCFQPIGTELGTDAEPYS